MVGGLRVKDGPWIEGGLTSAVHGSFALHDSLAAQKPLVAWLHESCALA